MKLAQIEKEAEKERVLQLEKLKFEEREKDRASNNLNQVSCLTINQQIFNELHEPYPR